MTPKISRARGVVTQTHGAGITLYERYHASPDLASFVEHFWTVHWDFTGRAPKVVETLPHPSVHLVFECGATSLGGVKEGRFSRKLEGKSFVFAVKFLPASFHGFYGMSLSKLTNRSVDPAEIFGTDFPAVEEKVLSASSTQERIELTQEFLRSRSPSRDQEAENLNELLVKISTDRSLTRVEQLPALYGGSVRRLQRLFRQYLGVSPKWVIGRYRIHEALERVHDHKKESWASLALELGYADQAHFIRDFKALVGKTPLAYEAEFGHSSH